MTTHMPTSEPHGLYRYIYNHYLVRCPNFHFSMSSLLTDELLDTVDKIDKDNLESYLENSSWLIAITRTDMDEAVRNRLGSLSSLARGNYLAGYTEMTFLGGVQDAARVSFITEQLGDDTSIEFTADTACQVGCALLGSGLIETFERFLRSNIDWEQEVERDSPTNFWRWKAIDRLSKRVIDVFLEASLILKQPDAAKLILDRGANPNTPVWQLERSSNALYPALSYAIKHGPRITVDALLEQGADPGGLEYAPMRSPLAVAFEKGDLRLIERLLEAGASLEDGPRHTQAPMTYGIGSPVKWVNEHLSELLGLLPIEAKPLFHSPHAQGGHYYTLLECVWGSPEKLTFAEEIGMDLRLTIHEVARLIQHKQYKAFSNLVGRLGDSVKKEALARVRKEWQD